MSLVGKQLRIGLLALAAALSLGLAAQAKPSAAPERSVAARLAQGEPELRGRLAALVLGARQHAAVREALALSGIGEASPAALAKELPNAFRKEPALWASVYARLQEKAGRAARPERRAAVEAGRRVSGATARATAQVASGRSLGGLFDGSRAQDWGAEGPPTDFTEPLAGEEPPKGVFGPKPPAPPPPGSGDRITFDDVVGIDEAKAELLEVVDMLKHPEEYRAVGAEIPTGILMMGEPGTGKTYSARALANEAGVCFESMEGSAFINMYVGQSAAKVREFFANARAKAPCIVFIDEVEALAGKRVDVTQGADREINGAVTQLLVEMDGLTENVDGSKKLIIVVGATNKADALDPAVLRPGRFDRKIIINKPDVKGREKVLELYVGKKKKNGVRYAADVDLKAVASRTIGMTPADLKMLVNEASLLTKRANLQVIPQASFLAALDRMVMGHARKIVLSEASKRETAIHELGHALVGTFARGGDPIGKITIVPRDIGALGVTTQELPTDRHNWTKTQLEARIAMAMGGRAAEKMWLDEQTTGPSSDLEQARKVARSMVVQFGMSPELGPVSLIESSRGDYLGGGGSIARDISPETQVKIDAAIRRIIEEQEKNAEAILVQNREILDQIVPILVKQETLEGAEFRALVKQFGGNPPGGGGEPSTASVPYVCGINLEAGAPSGPAGQAIVQDPSGKLRVIRFR
ncbi:MAG: ATP-dependent zinc metalloprotease FtsH [Elusimicrobia bacterium]|nr:ATP-dependent zinc metalloprotease FtsH [Elusimicrobiota bacterium]